MHNKDQLHLKIIFFKTATVTKSGYFAEKTAIISLAEREHWDLSFFLKTEHLVEIYTVFWLYFKSQLFLRDSQRSLEDMRSLSCNGLPDCQAKANIHHVVQ